MLPDLLLAPISRCSVIDFRGDPQSRAAEEERFAHSRIRQQLCADKVSVAAKLSVY